MTNQVKDMMVLYKTTRLSAGSGSEAKQEENKLRVSALHTKLATLLTHIQTKDHEQGK
jgi:hypothetical protein